MTPTEEAIVQACVERLTTAGAFHEARIIAGLRGDERDLLVLRESGWGMSTDVPQPVHRSVHRVSPAAVLGEANAPELSHLRAGLAA